MNKENITRPTIMEVNLKNFKYNIEQIKKIIPSETKIMPVIKANAYGTYINYKLDIINEFDIVAVAITDEGEKIRNIGYNKEIFILNQPDILEIDKIIKNNLTVGVCSKQFIKKIGEKNEKVKIHIEIETGMQRTGIKVSELYDFIEEIKKYNNIEIEGVYTHIHSAENKEYTNKQLEIFDEAVSILKNKVGNIKYIHCSASSAILNYSQEKYNLVRPGIIIYGYKSGEEIENKINLKPICKLKSKITFLKTVKKGESIGYGGSYITSKETKVATIPIGYADGFRRCLSNKWYVLIKGKKVPIIGKICMDSFMADVTELEDVKEGDDVYIWDNENIKLDEIANACETINYEILSTISERVLRKFIK